LSEAGVRSLNTTYSNSNEVDSSNNAYKQQGSFTTTAGTDNKMNVSAENLYIKIKNLLFPLKSLKTYFLKARLSL
jgi:hypothetical protein